MEPNNTTEREAQAQSVACKNLSTLLSQSQALQNFVAGLYKYTSDFMLPYLVATGYFGHVESRRLLNRSPLDTLKAYMGLAEFNYDLASRSLLGSLRALNSYGRLEAQKALSALSNTLLGREGEDLQTFMARQALLTAALIKDYPKAIRDIEGEYGFHFERGRDLKVDETDRFILYQVMPTHSAVSVEASAKPILIVPPYVLGANILGFLPGEDRSYTHCFANQGVPTYIRIMKDIHTSEALQTMTFEDDTRDNRRFLEAIKSRHGRKATLNGYCQGGFSTLCNLLSGELDGLVDALITCVSPMDGTRSKGLAAFLHKLPPRFNDLSYGTKTLPNGNKVADGDLMGWVYKLKSIEHEFPLVAFYRDLMMFGRQNGGQVKIGKTAAAVNYWLTYERSDLPLAITEMSFASYNVPITDDGTLPITYRGEKLNFKGLLAKKIPWLICYGENDDLVEKETALAPMDYIPVEVSPFPKGHIAIATSWSYPKSDCALHTRFGEGNYRGPVRFHMDLNEQRGEPAKSSSTRTRRAKRSQPPT